MDDKPVGASPLLGPRPPRPPARQYDLDRKDRLLLPLALLLGVLLFELAIAATTGLVATVTVAAWYAVMLWYKGPEGLWKGASRWLFSVVLLLALSFSLFSDGWFKGWNFIALPVLLCIQLFEWSGAGKKVWNQPTMLWERFLLTLDGLFGCLGAPLQAMRRKGEGRGRWVYVALGLAVAVPVLLLIAPLLISADPLFARFAGDFLTTLEARLFEWLLRLVAGGLLAPFLFGLLYTLRRPQPKRGDSTQSPAAVFSVDPALPITLLVVVNVLYAVFLAVQFAGLFGGEKYLAATGVSYADYARSGFFQLVTVSILNLAIILSCLQFSKQEGRGWQGVKIMSTVLVGASAVLLGSAAWKMTLYVTTYGLSFKRFLTYWGMVMLAIFFTAALLKIWRTGFSFFKIFFAAGLAGWLVLNYVNVDFLVAKYNVSLYQSSQTAVMDLPYLASLSYDTLAVLETLPGDTQVYHDRTDYPLSQLIAERRDQAKRTASRWQTWSLSAQLAAK